MAASKLPQSGPQELRGGLQLLTRSSDMEFVGLCSEKETNTPNANGLQHFPHKEENCGEEDEKPEFAVHVSFSCHILNKVQHQVALVGFMNACATQRDAHEGARLHAFLIRVGLFEVNVFIGSALVSMYAKCAALGKAKLVLDDLPIRNVVSWNGLIAGYIQHGFAEKALNCYECMQEEGLSPDKVTFSCILKACSSILAAEKGREIHAELVRRGLLEQDVVLGNALVDMYAKYGALPKVQQVFEELPVHNVVSWTILITGYSQHGHCEKALSCFENMKQEDLIPDLMTFSSILTACGHAGLLEKGRQVHAEMIRLGSSESGTVLGNSLLDMYAKCGVLARSKLVFEELCIRDVVSWNVLMGCYCEHGLGEEVLRCLELMSHDRLSPDDVTFTCILKACGRIGATEKGREIHAEIMRQGFVGEDNKLGNALVDMYAKCGALAKAQEVFKELSYPDVVSWTSLIRGLCQYGHVEEALNHFERLKKTGLLLDVVALAGILRACFSVGAINMGEELHAEIVKRGFLGVEIVLGDALVGMYAKCGGLVKAQQVFNDLHIRTLVSWNAVFIGNCQEGHDERILNLYELMKFEGVIPDAVSFSCVLKACSRIGAADKGQEVHVEIAREGLLEKCAVLGNGLLDMYIKCGLPVLAEQVFDELPCRDVVSWNVIIAGCCQYGRSEEAIYFFDQMKHDGLSPDMVTFACILKACGSIGAAEKGKEIHADLARKGFVDNDLVVGSALVDMYAKCGALSRAQEVFYKLPSRDVVSWTTLIGGYCEHGRGVDALECFEMMRSEGLSPDAVTFACILKACGSIAATKKGHVHFESISRRYGIRPTVEHHTSMVDLHSRAGHFDEAMSLIKKTPSSDSLPLWLAFLGACQKWGNWKLGKVAFEHGVQAAKEPSVQATFWDDEELTLPISSLVSGKH